MNNETNKTVETQEEECQSKFDLETITVAVETNCWQAMIYMGILPKSPVLVTDFHACNTFVAYSAVESLRSRFVAMGNFKMIFSLDKEADKALYKVLRSMRAEESVIDGKNLVMTLCDDMEILFDDYDEHLDD